MPEPGIDDDDVYEMSFLHEEGPTSPESKIRGRGQAANKPHTLQVVVPAKSPGLKTLQILPAMFEDETADYMFGPGTGAAFRRQSQSFIEKTVFGLR